MCTHRPRSGSPTVVVQGVGGVHVSTSEDSSSSDLRLFALASVQVQMVCMLCSPYLCTSSLLYPRIRGVFLFAWTITMVIVATDTIGLYGLNSTVRDGLGGRDPVPVCVQHWPQNHDLWKSIRKTSYLRVFRPEFVTAPFGPIRRRELAKRMHCFQGCKAP